MAGMPPELQRAIEAWSVMDERLRDFRMIGDVLKLAGSIHTAMAELEGRRNELQKSITQMEERLRDVTAENDAYRSEMTVQRLQLESEQTTLRQKWGEEKEQYQQDRMQLRASCERVKTEIAILQQQKTHLDAQIQGLKEDMRRRYDEVTR